MLQRMWSKENTHPLLVGMQICAATLQISVAVSQETSGPSNSTLENISSDALSYYKAFVQLCL